MRQTPKKTYQFQENTLMRYNDDQADKTTFIFGKRKASAELRTTLIKIMRLRDAVGVIPHHERTFEIHKIKMMKMINPRDRTDFILMEYIDTFEGYGVLGADMLNNPLWSNEDETNWNRTFNNETTPIREHPNVFKIKNQD